MGLAFQKSGVTPKQERARKRRRQLAEEAAIKAMVRIRDGHQCRVCGRRAESVHEIRPKGAGGKVSMENSIATCGDGIRGCHGFAQRHEVVVWTTALRDIDANLPLMFHANTCAAQRWIYNSEYVIEDGVRFA